MGHEIRVPFKAFFRQPLLDGRKTKTARTKRLGEPGDFFTAFGQKFILVRVKDLALFEVKAQWREEGCRSEEHFIEVWNSIHPVRKYSDYQRVYLHCFRMY